MTVGVSEDVNALYRQSLGLQSGFLAKFGYFSYGLSWDNLKIVVLYANGKRCR